MMDVELVSMKNVGEIFSALGGLSAVARILSKGPSTISEMKRRGNIPVEYWPVLILAAADPVLAERDQRQAFVLTSDIILAAHVPPPAMPALLATG